MRPDDDEALRVALRLGLDPLRPDPDFEPRVVRRLHGRVAARARRASPFVLSATVSVVVAAALIAGILVTRGPASRIVGPPKVTPTKPMSVLSALGAAGAASSVPNPTSAFVWLTNVTGTKGDNVAVLDWTGTVRYRFQVPNLASDGIVAVSADGTRALLANGTVLAETGKPVGHLGSIGTLLSAALSDLPFGPVSVRWLSDDSGVCVAGPSAWLAHPTLAAAQLKSPSGAAPYSTVTIEEFPMSSQPRSVARLDVGATAGDRMSSTNWLAACNTSSDMAVMAHFTASGVSVGAFQLSTGRLRYQQRPPARSSAGQRWVYGSEDGSLVGEFLWNSKVAGCSSVAVLQLPSGKRVPGTASLTCPDITGMTADGSRVLLRDVNAQADTRTTLKLVAASTGQVIRSVQLPGLFGAQSVASPDGTHLMLLIDGYLVLVDGNGGITQLHPRGVDLSGDYSSFGFAGMPPGYVQG
jgi:hypothetical protein